MTSVPRENNTHVSTQGGTGPERRGGVTWADREFNAICPNVSDTRTHRCTCIHVGAGWGRGEGGASLTLRSPAGDRQVSPLTCPPGPCCWAERDWSGTRSSQRERCTTTWPWSPSPCPPTHKVNVIIHFIVQPQQFFFSTPPQKKSSPRSATLPHTAAHPPASFLEELFQMWRRYGSGLGFAVGICVMSMTFHSSM